MKKQTIIICAAAVCLVLMPVAAYSLPVSGAGINGGSFTGSIDIVYRNDNSLNAGTPWLIISLTNASAKDNLFISGYTLPGGVTSVIGPVGTGDTWSGRQSLLIANRSISVESMISGFVVLFSDSSGQLIDKAPVAVPEPSTMLLLGFGLLAVGAGLRKRS